MSRSPRSPHRSKGSEAAESSEQAVLRVRPARETDCETLTEIARAAEAHWGYPEDWLSAWRPELTITPGTLREIELHLAEVDGRSASGASGPVAFIPGGRRTLRWVAREGE